MTKIDLIDGELDFHERMKQLGELFCRIVYSKLAAGKEPSNIANLLADYAEHSQNCSDPQATNVQAQQIHALSSLPDYKTNEHLNRHPVTPRSRSEALRVGT